MSVEFWVCTLLRSAMLLAIANTVPFVFNTMVVLFICFKMNVPSQRAQENQQNSNGIPQPDTHLEHSMMCHKVDLSLLKTKIEGTIDGDHRVLRQVSFDWTTINLSNDFKLLFKESTSTECEHTWLNVQKFRAEGLEDVNLRHDLIQLFRETLPQAWEVVDWSHRLKHLFKEVQSPILGNIDWSHAFKHLFKQASPDAWMETDWSQTLFRLTYRGGVEQFYDVWQQFSFFSYLISKADGCPILQNLAHRDSIINKQIPEILRLWDLELNFAREMRVLSKTVVAAGGLRMQALKDAYAQLAGTTLYYA